MSDRQWYARRLRRRVAFLVETLLPLHGPVRQRVAMARLDAGYFNPYEHKRYMRWAYRTLAREEG